MDSPPEKVAASTTVVADHAADASYSEGVGAGDLQVFKLSDSGNLKLAKDGMTVLIPQPSDDPNDPLNWSTWKKHGVLLSIILPSLLTDFGMTYGSPLFASQAPSFHTSVVHVSQSISGALFLQGASGVLVVPIVQRYGRLPVLFWSQFLCALMVTLAAISPNYASFTAFRSLQGFVNTAPQILGLSMVHDMFFFHERTRKINLWAFLLMLGPFAGAFTAAWLISVIDWRADFGVLAAFHVVSTLVVILVGDETLYDRNNPLPRQKGVLAKVKLVLGITGVKESKLSTSRPSMSTVFIDIARIQIRPHILLTCGVFIIVLFAWEIAINFTIPQFIVPPPYNFGPAAEAWSWVAPMIGAVLGELWGHWFNDWLCRRYVKRHNGIYVLENRLWGCYAPTLLFFLSLILYGQALQHTLHWAVLLVAWGMVAFGIVACTTAVSAYILDSFPHHASLVASIINFWRTAGGFCTTYFLVPWVSTDGAGLAFGIMAMILGVAFLVGIVPTQYFGRRWRAKYPPLKAEN